MTRTALVTGASGFIGRACVDALRGRGDAVVAAVRAAGRVVAEEGTGDASAGAAAARGPLRVAAVGDLGADTDWRAALRGVDVVVHCAARVHVMRDEARDPLARYRAANVEGTRALARQAADAGVRRFVYLSSVKVHGERTSPGHPFDADAPLAPQDPYGRSKAEAEEALREVARATGLEVAIVRPPLVYGPGAKANFHAMARALQRGLPLPFGRLTTNRRSLVALDNLVSLVLACADHAAAAGEAFLAADGEDLSTAELLRRTAAALGVPARLVPVPRALLGAAARVVGRGDLWDRLAGDLQVDASHARRTLGWTPPVSVDEGLRRAVAGLRDVRAVGTARGHGS